MTDGGEHESENVEILDRDIADLIELKCALDAGRPVDASVAPSLSLAIDDFMNGLGGLEECLGLRPQPGQRSVATRYRIYMRNTNLKAAFQLISMEAKETPWQRTMTLLAEIKKFDVAIWPRWQSLSNPPEGTSRLRTHLFRAFKTGLIIPRTTEGLSKALFTEQSSQYSVRLNHENIKPSETQKEG